MQRSIEEIVEWNIKKIQSKASCMQQRLKEISQKARNGQFDDVLDANLIVNNMGITMEQLEYDMNRLLGPFSGEGIGTSEKLAAHDSYLSPESPQKLDVHNRSRSYKDLTLEKQMHQTSEVKDSLAFDKVVRQIKALEGIVLSGNVIERIGKLEKEQTPRNLVPRLEIMEKNLLNENLPCRVVALEKGTFVDISTRLEKLEALVQQTVKGVFGDDFGIGSRTPCVVNQLSTIENQLNEGRARIHGMEEKLNSMEPIESKNAAPDPIKKDEDITIEESDDDDDELWDERSVTCSEFSTSAEDVRFSVILDHGGPWENGTVIRSVKHVNYNEGDTFDVDKCWFIPPVDGRYKITLKIKRSESGSTRVEVWQCDAIDGGWIDCLFSVQLQNRRRYKCFWKFLPLKAGEKLRLRVFDGTPIESCVFQSKLLKQ